jgi:hypothetical protein
LAVLAQLQLTTPLLLCVHFYVFSAYDSYRWFVRIRRNLTRNLPVQQYAWLVAIPCNVIMMIEPLGKYYTDESPLSTVRKKIKIGKVLLNTRNILQPFYLSCKLLFHSNPTRIRCARASFSRGGIFADTLLSYMYIMPNLEGVSEPSISSGKQLRV